MTPTLLFPMPANERLTAGLAEQLDCEMGELNTRQFPDGETYLRFVTDLNKRSVAIVCTLSHPNEKILPLIFAAATARELGASKVGLIAPYLAYMRQDRRFNPGEAVTSRQVAHLISEAFDWMVTVDPHLHRYNDLSEIYSIPTRVVHAAPLVSRWIKANSRSRSSSARTARANSGWPWWQATPKRHTVFWRRSATGTGTSGLRLEISTLGRAMRPCSSTTSSRADAR
jgi:ribose-phosphate pyrophosphokinase